MRPSIVLLLALSLGTAIACRTPASAGSPDAGSFNDGNDADAAQDRPRLRIATINLRCLVDGWEQRLPLLTAEIAAVDPDVMAFEEVCREEGGIDSLAQLMAALAAETGSEYYTARAETHLAWDQYQEGIALASRYPLQDEQVVDLPVGIFPRRSVMARVDNPIMPLQMAVTHLSFGDQAGVREAQLAAVREALENRQGNDERAILAGDLNEGPDGAAIGSALSAGYVDAWAHLHPDNDGPTYPASAPSKRIDYLLLAPAASSIEALRVERFMLGDSNGIRPSDHIALWVDVTP